MRHPCGSVAIVLALVGVLVASAAEAADVAAPDMTARYGTQIEVPVQVSGIAGDVFAVELTIAFDPAVVTLDLVAVGGTLTEGWLLETVRVVGDPETIAFAAATASAPIQADGTLLLLTFTLTDERLPATSPVEIQHAMLNAGFADAVTDGSITIVGEDGAAVATVVAQPGDTVRVRVTDPDLDVDPGVAETVTVALANTRTGETGSVVLGETDVDSGTFFGEYYTDAADPGADGNATLGAVRGDILQAVYTDVLSAAGATEPREAPTTTVDPFGDASLNGTVRGFDAGLILDHSVGAITLTGLAALSANVDELAPYGDINGHDASLVLQYNVGLLERFPVRLPDADNQPQPETGAAAPRRLVSGRPLTLTPAADGTFVLTAVPGAGLWSGQLRFVGFDGHVEAGAALAEALLASHRDGDVTRVAFAATRPIDGGELLRFTDTAATPQIDEVSFNNGRLRGELDAGAGPVVPQRFALHPATPNPFNPGTTIAFDLERYAAVRLEILNLLGQPVRVLVDGERAAGQHLARWDGTDDAGRAVGAGVYFHRLTAAGHSAVGKMTLAR